MNGSKQAKIKCILTAKKDQPPLAYKCDNN